MARALDWIVVVVVGFAAMTSGFLAAMSQLAAERPGAAGLEVRVLGVAVEIGSVPAWPWFVATPLLMTATFLLIERAHDRAAARRGDPSGRRGRATGGDRTGRGGADDRG